MTDAQLDDLEGRLVWIWGSPRSGSSWLLEQLCDPLKPTIKAPAGYVVADARAAIDPELGFDSIPIDEPFIANHLAPAFSDPVDVEGILYPGILNSYAGESGSYSLSLAHRDAWLPEFRRMALTHLQSLIERGRDQGLQISERPVLVIKEVNGSHASDLVMSMLPRSRMLFLARDGRDVVDSLLAAYAPGGFLARNQGVEVNTVEERREKISWAARLWACNVDTSLRAATFHPTELSRIVRYEDLLADAASELGRLLEWIGLRRDPGWIEATAARHSFSSLPAKRRGEGRRARSAKPGRWRENFSESEQIAVAGLVEPRLIRLNYEL